MSNTWKIYMLTIISFVVGTSQLVIVGILNKVAASVGVSVSTAGQLISVFALANAVGTPIVMVTLAKWNQRKQLLLALVIILLGIVSTIALPGFGFLMVARIILGVGTGVFVVNSYSIAAKLAAPGHRAAAMSNVSIGFSASTVFGIPIGVIVTTAFDWKMNFWILGVLSLVALYLVFRIIPSTEAETPVPLRQQLALLKNRKIAIALCVSFVMFTSYSAVNTFITPILLAITPMGAQELSIILFILGLASLVGAKSGGILADRIGTARTLVGCMTLQAITLVLVSLIFGSVSIVSLLLLLFWTIGVWIFGPTQNFNLLSIAPDASGIMLSLNSSFTQFGFAAGAAVGGITMSSWSTMGITWVGAAAVALGAIIAAVAFDFSRTSSVTQD
ncbi:MAG: MFS transporter [Sporolactobacillus sp.]